MTNKLNPDRREKNEYLPFAAGELDRSGLRLTRAEFARFLQVSKQAVGEWVAAGKITLGSDGRLDPRQAVSQLMRNADPARLRSKVLAPLMKEVGTAQVRIAELEKQLAAAKENADFHEGASLDLIGQQDRLHECLQAERDALAKLPARQVIDAIIAWLGDVCFSGHASGTDLSISDFIPTGAHEENIRGDGDE